MDDLIANPLIPSHGATGGIDLSNETLNVDEAINLEIQELRDKENWVGAVRLESGRLMAIKPARTALTEHHFLAYFPSCQGTPKLGTSFF